MSDDGLLHMRSGRVELVLAPRVGGSIARLDFVEDGRRVPLLRPTDKSHYHIEEAASFPLVPWCNRIRDGRFAFRGRTVAISRNKATDASPLHGHGWLSEWETLGCEGAQAEIRYRHAAGEWPWDYEARQLFRLDDDGLSLRISCRNLSDEPMPCGLGHHPYYGCTAETRIDTGVGHVWTVDDKILPVDRIPADGRYAMADRLVCEQELDNGYDGWSGEAVIRTPGSPVGVKLSSPDARFFQFYSPKPGDFFVAEPVSHANAALNEPEARWAELGMRVIEPGEEMTLDARIEAIRN